MGVREAEALFTVRRRTHLLGQRVITPFDCQGPVTCPGRKVFRQSGRPEHLATQPEALITPHASG